MFLEIQPLCTEEAANRIVGFFFSEYAFDDRRHTPGEVEHFKKHPFTSLIEHGAYYYYIENQQREIIAVIGFSENEQKTGGYTLDYLAVHKNHRMMGLASRLMDHMFTFLKSTKGRYIHTYTCDLEEYQSAIHLFLNNGFQQVDYCPDYYFEGEGRYIYYKKL